MASESVIDNQKRVLDCKNGLALDVLAAQIFDGKKWAYRSIDAEQPGKLIDVATQTEIAINTNTGQLIFCDDHLNAFSLLRSSNRLLPVLHAKSDNDRLPSVKFTY